MGETVWITSGEMTARSLLCGNHFNTDDRGYSYRRAGDDIIALAKRIEAERAAFEEQLGPRAALVTPSTDTPINDQTGGAE
jgi:hypothetical protein